MTALILMSACGRDSAPQSDAGVEASPFSGDSVRVADNAEPFHAQPLQLPVEGRTGFTRLPVKDLGIHPGGAPQWKRENPAPWVVNAGLAAGDVDGDGRCDLFICGMDGPNALYRNLGDWKFEDVSETAGVRLEGRNLTGAAMADVDGDKDLDLVVVSLDSPNALFLNDGSGRFTESREVAWRRTNVGGDISAAFGDVDGDGDLDMYVATYVKMGIKEATAPAIYDRMVDTELDKIERGEQPDPTFAAMFNVVSNVVDGKLKFDVREKGAQDTLYLNDGRGGFRAVADDEDRFRDEDGKPIPMPRDWGLCATFRDVDKDGDPDLYVCNDFQSPDRFWINDGQGRFQLAPRLALRRTSYFSMGVDFADINRDGHLDFITVDMLSRDHTRRKTQMGDMQATDLAIGVIDDRPQVMQNTLFLGRGDGSYAEIAQLAGLRASEWSWSPLFLDVDLDGYEDLIVSTGMIRDFMDSDTNDKIEAMGERMTDVFAKSTAHLFPTLETRNMIFRNRGDLTFKETGEAWGVSVEGVSGGMALADFDNDGDLDVVVNNTGSEPEVYRNESIAPRVAVKLAGTGGNSRGVGARIRLSGSGAPQEREMVAGGSYAAGSEPIRVFAAAGGEERKLEVFWPDGRVSEIREVKPNHLYTVRQAGASKIETPAAAPESLFADVSGRLDHTHTESPFDDFKAQSLLPNRLSQLGPGVCWADLDGDGDDDLLIGGGRGGELARFMNDGAGNFQRAPGLPAPDDVTTVLFTPGDVPGGRILSGQQNYETAAKGAPSFHMSDARTGRTIATRQGILDEGSATGAMALADVDGDGDLDLFIGGRSLPGRYPKAASSRLLLNQGGVYEADSRQSETFVGIGLVSGAVFGDLLDEDGDPELVLAMEWGAVRVFRNERGLFKEATEELGLDRFKGWWNGAALGDVDGDGRLDIVASNWGRNTKYEHAYSLESPLRIHHGDLDKNGVWDIVENHYDKAMNCWVPERGFSCSSRGIDFIKPRIKTFSAFGASALGDIYGNNLGGAEVVEANTLEHAVFLNRGGGFERRALPVESQFAPAMAVCVGDFDGDGAEDVFLGQNFFAVQRETPRCDGGRGIVLLGGGDGSFAAASGEESGVRVHGEQRGAALADFNADGRVDLLVTQNGARTRLFENRNGRPGLRVRLNAGPKNTTGVGAVARLVFDGRKGPARQVAAGSGYWSQDSATLVMATPERPTEVQVRWPDGTEQTEAVAAGANEISIERRPVGR